MSEKLVIKGGSQLVGEIDVRGSKNAATPILSATLLTSQPCILDNLPKITDVFKMLEIMEKMGSKVEFISDRKIRVESKDIDPKKLDFDLVSQMRSSILLVGSLISRFGYLEIPHPGGCIIGSRSIDTHISGLKKLGVFVEENGLKKNGAKQLNKYKFRAEKRPNNTEVVLDEFSVTATENIIMASVLCKGKTTIKIAAAEPHVRELVLFLKKMGAKIKGEETHTISITGVDSLSGAEYFIPYDYVEAGTFILLAVAGKGKIDVKNVPVNDLSLFLHKINSFGVKLKVKKDIVQISPWKKLKIDKIQTMPHPGIPTDLQSPLGVLSTQAEGLTLIHDPLYEGRLKYLEELNKMGAEIVLCDPHRAIINGPTKLQGTKLDPLDLRSGAALIIAGIIAEGTTIIRDVTQADRGYEEIENRLLKIGADIKREK